MSDPDRGKMSLEMSALEQPEFQRYQPTRKIRAVGTYYTVFEAIQKGLERSVELRILNCSATEDSPEFRRFAAEFKTLAGLDHPNIVRVHDLGIVKGHVFYVTDLRKASSLREVLERGKELSFKEVTALGRSLASALEHLHHRRVIHRNISIDSIHLEEETGTPYIAEFSLAKNFNLDNLSGVGIPHVVALMRTPEVALGHECTERTDLYMLGTVLFRLLTCKQLASNLLPHTDDPREEERRLHPRSFNPQVPVELDSVVARCLQPDPEERFASATLLREALDAAHEKLVVRSALQKISGDVQVGQMRGTLARQHDVAERCRDNNASRKTKQFSFENLQGVPATNASGEVRRTTLMMPLPEPTFWDRNRALVIMVATIGTLLGAGSWTVRQRMHRAPPELAQVEGVPAIPRGKPDALQSMPRFDEELKRTILEVPASPATRANFHDRWYLLESWLNQLERERSALPFTHARLREIRQASYSGDTRPCAQLDELYARAEAHIGKSSK